MDNPVLLFQSTHSITECDNQKRAAKTINVQFQSTHSITECGSATSPALLSRPAFQSTHSITECDSINRPLKFMAPHFNPRTPLQSATVINSKLSVRSVISIHALHYRVRRDFVNTGKVFNVFQSTHSITECDQIFAKAITIGGHFNPRTPLQSATANFRNSPSTNPFQSTHSITECDVTL